MVGVEDIIYKQQYIYDVKDLVGIEELANMSLDDAKVYVKLNTL